MKRIPKKAINTLINHAMRDISFGWAGSYGGGIMSRKDGGIDMKAVKRAERAIDWIQDNLLKS